MAGEVSCCRECNPAKEVNEIRNKLLERSVASFKKKRKSHFVDESGVAKKLWLGLLIIGIFLFAWNEIGALLRKPHPNTILMERALHWLNGLLPAKDSGEGLLRSLLASNSAIGHFQFGLVPEAIHFLICIAPIMVPLGILLSRSRSFAHELESSLAGLHPGSHSTGSSAPAV